MTGVESMQLMRAEFEERGEDERLKLPDLIALLSKPVTMSPHLTGHTYTILISNKR